MVKITDLVREKFNLSTYPRHFFSEKGIKITSFDQVLDLANGAVLYMTTKPAFRYLHQEKEKKKPKK